MRAIDPATGRLVREVPLHDLAAATERARAAAAAQAAYARTDSAARAGLLERLAARLEARADELASTMAEEMGKPLAEGRAEAKKCALVARHYAEHGARYLADEEVVTDARRALVVQRPLGVVLAIMPWNFPLWQLMRFAAPALAAGNGLLHKPAPNVPGCAQAIESLFAEAEAPAGLFANVLVDEEKAGRLIDDPHVAAVTLTGSTRAGRAVAARAGAALKKSVLELGGSDPAVVLADADLDHAAEQCARGRLINGGQSCIAAKRFVVERAVLAPFRERLLAHLTAARVGDPRDPATSVGPLAREDLRAALHHQVQESVGRGARLSLGGTLPSGPGWFYPVTLLEDVRPDMPAWDEELFGPVAVLIAAEDEADAVRIANDTPYGLGASLYTRDREKGERLAREALQAGSTFVNGFVRSDPRLPFGGIKQSGYGRELGRAGILEFVNTTSVWID